METTLVREDAVVGENSLSCLEKYLLRKSWTVEDRCDQASGLVLTVSRSPEGRELTYPHPAYEYPDQNRGQILAETLDRLADIEGRPQTEIRLDMRSAIRSAPPGFLCRLCGQCCGRMRDAFQGRVSPEEVADWQHLGLTHILRLVVSETKDAHTIYTAWKNPKTGRYFKRCPWLRTGPDGRHRICAIHAFRPLKCRSFPLSLEHAEYSHCRAFEPPDPAVLAPVLPQSPAVLPGLAPEPVPL